MTAPSAAHLPLSVRPLPVRPARSRPRRLLSTLAAVALLAAAASGCVTVHGETALVPSVRKADAVKALNHFVKVSNEAQTKYDPALPPEVETGALGAIDTAGIKAGHINTPKGQPNFPPLVLSDSRFLIPRQRGWPKWFVADSANNKNKRRYVLVFIRDSVDQPWKASYLVLLTSAQLTQFATDSQGYEEPVPVTGSDLLVQPGELGSQYSAYLQQGDKGSTAFADGPYTSEAYASQRSQSVPTPQSTLQFADQAADPVSDPPVALRLANGGALVFFSAQSQVRKTVTNGPIALGEGTELKALLTGTPNKSLTVFDVSEQAATVPTSGSGSGAKVTLLSQIDEPVSVRGQ